MPEWVTKLLQEMGIAGAIISTLISVVLALAGGNVAQWRHSLKVYRYRLAERDTLNKALTDAAKVLADMLEATEERNEITEEQADLIDKQSVAFKMLEQTVSMQFAAIRENHNSSMDTGRVAAQAVAAMASSIQQLHQLVMENRITFAEGMNSIRQEIQNARQAIIAEMRQIIGTEATVIVRRKIADTRPNKRP